MNIQVELQNLWKNLQLILSMYVINSHLLSIIQKTKCNCGGIYNPDFCALHSWANLNCRWQVLIQLQHGIKVSDDFYNAVLVSEKSSLGQFSYHKNWFRLLMTQRRYPSLIVHLSLGKQVLNVLYSHLQFISIICCCKSLCCKKS